MGGDHGGDAGSSKSPSADFPLLDFSLAEAPILLLVYFHKALKEDLSDLCRVALEGLECGGGESVVGELKRRFDFIKLAYNYHCAAEDEVIFLALDMHVKNVACTYSLEHENIDGLFDLIFRFLNELEEERQDLKPFQELVVCIYNLECSICQHMLKEEQQVFPLLMKQFSPEQQASFVWQFFCSIPIVLLEDLLPWMMSFLCVDKQIEVIHCIREIVPEELMQKVVISWISRDDQLSNGSLSKERKGFLDAKSVLQLHSKRSLEYHWQGEKTETNAGKNVFDSLHLWHGAIQADLKEILEQLHQMRSSNSSLDVDSIVIRIRFLADVVIFYSNAVKKFFYPMLNELGENHFHLSAVELSSIENGIESLHQLLRSDAQTSLTLGKFLQKLCKELESFLLDIGKRFNFHEAEVFPIISRNCSPQSQIQLLYVALHEMPLGLLKCIITWFAARLSENDSKSILNGINQGDFLSNKSFSSLLLEWFHIGYSGKTSIENFGIELQKIFHSRCSLLPEQVKESVGCPSLHSDIQPFEEFKRGKLEPLTANKGKSFLSRSSLASQKDKKYLTSYSSEINLHVLFPETRRTLHPFYDFHGEENSGSSLTNEPVPVDLLFYFHKAIKKDLDCVVLCSAQLAENVGALVEFRQHFHLLQFRNQFHNDAEDDIAFPALEAEGKVENISQSYRIDHKLEVRIFSEISVIVDEISTMQARGSTFDPDLPDERMVKYKHLCMKLHHICKSMHKLISDHIHREEIELWPLFRKCLTIQEQEKIIGLILGRINAEKLQDMIPWLMSSLTPEEQSTMMSIWRKVTRKTMFDEWLGEWWEVYNRAQLEEESDVSGSADPLEIISSYLFVENPEDSAAAESTDSKVCRKDPVGNGIEKTETCEWDERNGGFRDEKSCISSDCNEVLTGTDDSRYTKADGTAEETNKPLPQYQVTLQFKHNERLLTISQDDLEAAIRRVNRDSSLDAQKKSFIIQNLLMSRWIVQKKISQAELNSSTGSEGIPGQHPSYRDSVKIIMGCKHYTRNCKLLFPCCNQLFTCIRCHDEVSDHSANRGNITKMMCMKCLVIQPIEQTCSSVSCNNLSMARYYCRICKLFEERRQIYHCPYCNICRVGKGLGIDYFHCMNCNACMSRSLLVHICREKCLEDNCPICHEYIFTSSNPVKALPCGHLMHSTCFLDYTFSHYTCPICGKSLGDMQVYFKMLDALLAEEKIPDEYSSRTQVILCNDCEKKGDSPFHWIYHKCPYCGSYSTRVL